MYTLLVDKGIVVRDADAVQVAPAQSIEDPNFMEYQAWIQAGNNPTVVYGPPVIEGSRKHSKLEFRRLFTLQERMILDSAADNQSLPADVRSAMKTLMTDLSLAEEVDLDNPDTIYGLNFIASVGLVTPERIAAILG